ncbi:MAG: CPBP family intramembrane metalloprotease [Lachnospiraceae bacterium]|nr:CPBP family intramembrane metalloprotease [Lachnospiraceae bacterium]
MKTNKVIIGSIAAIFVLVFSQICAQLVASGFHITGISIGICNIIAGIIYILLSYFLLNVLVSKFLKTDIKILRITVNVKWIIVAIVLPVIVKGIYLLLPGEFVSSGIEKNQIFTTLSSGIAFTGIAAGFVEEMVFRGVIMSLIRERWNTKAAILVPSVLFASVHLIGMNFSALSCILVLAAGTMVGVMFSMIAIESDSVWNSGIVHSIWNIIIIGGGLSISEKANEYSVMTYVLDSKSFAITGGEFGIEASVIALVGYIVVTLFAFVIIKRRRKNALNSSLTF